MTDMESLKQRLESLSEGRGSVPRLKDGVLSLVLDITGLDEDKRRLLLARLNEELRREPGVREVRIAETAEKKQVRIIAVASGKGGVGKSTLSANLALALQQAGVKVGLVDADIYGPSQPRLMHSEGQRPQARDNKIIPVRGAGDLPMLSMGHLVEPGQAIAWRGPMAANALGQLIDAHWGDVELLVVDMPPGTGDVQLSMVQKHKPAGVVIVSTPQDLALMDAVRAIDLFRKADVPIIGLVENMAGYACPHCGEVSDPFGSGGAAAAAKQMDMAFLGRIPLSIDIRRASDAGNPPAAGNDADAQAFKNVARTVADWLRTA